MTGLKFTLGTETGNSCWVYGNGEGSWDSERISAFTWIALHGKLQTDFKRSKHGLANLLCHWCRNVIHVLRGCTQARIVPIMSFYPPCVSTWHHVFLSRTSSQVAKIIEKVPQLSSPDQVYKLQIHNLTFWSFINTQWVWGERRSICYGLGR